MHTILQKILNKYKNEGVFGVIKSILLRIRNKANMFFSVIKAHIIRKYICFPIIYTDIIISIGGACRPAQYLRELKLRNFSSPFDWMMNYKVSDISNFMRNGFSNFFKNYEINNNWDGANWWVVDKITGMVSIHDFDKKSPVEENYNEFIKKMNNRFNNLLTQIKNAKNVCFISNRGEITDELKDFLYFIDSFFPNHNFICINIINSPIEYFKKIRVAENLIIYNIYFNDIHKNGSDKSTNKDFWLGNVDKWRQYLSYIRIREHN